MSDRQYVGLFLLANGIWALVYPHLSEGYGPKMTEWIEDVFRLPHLLAVFSYIITALIMIVLGVRLLARR